MISPGTRLAVAAIAASLASLVYAQEAYLSEPTGGYFEIVSSGAMLEAAVGRVADDLRDQYVLAFEPAQTDGKFHAITVKTRGMDHRVRARSGYVAGVRR